MLANQRATARVIAGPPAGRRTQWTAIHQGCDCRKTGEGLHVYRVGEAAALFAGQVERYCREARRTYLLQVVDGD
jgi:hypothetical protein